MEFHKYRKIYQIGHSENEDIFKHPTDRIVVEEKMDGGNFRFYITEAGEVIVGSRGQLLDLESKNTKNFRRCSEFVKEKVYACPNYKDFGKLIFYGECMIKHTMNYDWENMPPYLGFDIMTEEGMFLEYEAKKNAFEHFGLPIVPFIKDCEAQYIGEINDEAVPKSAYASPSNEDQQAEGIVFKNYQSQIMAKYVRDKFKERNAEAFGGNPKYNKIDDTNNSEFVFKYCTNPRIDKTIFKLMDEGHPLDLKMMAELPKKIYKDIIEENWQEIMESNWKLDFKNIRKLIPKRCLAVLKQVMVNNAINQGVKE